jgi:hypothetical protein
MLRLMVTSSNHLPSGDDDFLDTKSEYEFEYNALVQSEALWAMADNLGLDVRERRFVWSDGSRRTLEESMEHIRGRRPDFSALQVEGFLVSFIENYLPEKCTEAEMDEVDRLAEQWLGELEDAREAD